MGKIRYALSLSAAALSLSAAAQVDALREVLKGCHPQLRTMRLAARDDVELTKAAAKKKKIRDKNKAARASRRKAR